MNKTFLLVICTALLLPVCFTTVSAQESDPLTPIDRKVMKELTGVKETANIVFHYRPSDVDDKTLANVVQLNLDKFELCE